MPLSIPHLAVRSVSIAVLVPCRSSHHQRLLATQCCNSMRIDNVSVILLS